MIRLCIILLAVLALAGTAHAEHPDSEENTLWTLVNDYRQAHGASPVGLNDNLMAAAEWMSEDMAGNDRYSHTDSLGRSLRQRMTDFGYSRYAWTGEVLTAGWDTAQEAFDAFRASPEHSDTMLRPYYFAVGIARAYDPDSTYGWYWTIDFGGRGPAWFPPTPVPIATPTPIPTPTPAPVLEIVSAPVAIPVELPSTGTGP